MKVTVFEVPESTYPSFDKTPSSIRVRYEATKFVRISSSFIHLCLRAHKGPPVVSVIRLRCNNLNTTLLKEEKAVRLHIFMRNE